MKWIPLTKLQFAVVDDEDYEWLSQWNWCAGRKGNGFSAVRGITVERGKTRHVHMHRVVMNAPDDMVVDHINGNPLDNRRCNLRVCTQAQNMLNRRAQKNNRSSRYKGVNLQRKPYGSYWRAHFRGEHLGNFESEELAAKAYDAAATSHSNFSPLNFPEVALS